MSDVTPNQNFVFRSRQRDLANVTRQPGGDINSYYLACDHGHRLADLVSISADLDIVETCCNFISENRGVPESATLRMAALDSAAIRYRRCFSGPRFKLRRDYVSAVDLELVHVHDWFYALADKHVAHSVSLLESNLPVVSIYKAPNTPDQLYACGVISKCLLDAGEYTEQMALLCRKLVVQLALDMDNAEEGFVNSVLTLPPNKLASLKPIRFSVRVDASNATKRRHPARG